MLKALSTIALRQPSNLLLHALQPPIKQQPAATVGSPCKEHVNAQSADIPVTSTDQVRLMQTWARCNADGFRGDLYSLKKTAEGRDKGKKEGTTDKVLYTTVLYHMRTELDLEMESKKKKMCCKGTSVVQRGNIDEKGW